MKIILASESPRRKDLLKQIGMEFSVLSCGGEAPVDTKIPKEVVEAHALQKAQAVAENISERVVILGSDTVVALDGEILEKPKSEQEACEMLNKLQNNTHEVYTGVALLKKKSDGTWEKNVFAECTKVVFYPMTETEIKEYVATGEPMDKAGSYGIQGVGAKYVKEILGDYNNVVGLPVAKVYQELKRFGETE